MPPSPNNFMPDDQVTYQFLVEVTVDPNHPKVSSIEAIQLRIADGPQWLDGVRVVDTKYCGILRYEVA